MLTESIPVKHKTNTKLAAGIIVGNEVFNSVDANGNVKTSLIFLVVWENHPTITPHPNSELIHLVPVEDWYQEYFVNLQGEDLELSDDDEDFDPEETIIKDDEAPVIELHQTVSNDDAINEASTEFAD